jgi:ribosomal protein S18 acetylase RimI-like enzyme
MKFTREWHDAIRKGCASTGKTWDQCQMSSPSGPRFPLVQLTAYHDLHGFTSGNHPGSSEIDEYLETSALAEQAAGLSRVWIATDLQAASSEEFVAGYFALSPLSIPIAPAILETLGLASAPYRTVGGYLLGRLGVAASRQGQGLGPSLVAAAIKIAKRARTEVGGAFLAVDPKNDKLLAWYESLDFGFRRLDPGKRRIILKL